MTCTYKDIKRSKGVLTPISGGNSVAVDYCELDDESAKKLLKTLEKESVSPENQEIFFNKITIKSYGVGQFSKGQSDLIKIEGGYALSANSAKNPARFKADMDAPMVTKDSYICHFQIGNIDFDLENADKQDLGEATVYQNVNARIYPYGTYSAFINKDKEEI